MTPTPTELMERYALALSEKDVEIRYLKAEITALRKEIEDWINED